MANQEQLAILKQGVEVWNEWRKKNPSVEIDLSTTDHSMVSPWVSSLMSINLSNVDFSKANLSEADLNGADLSKANLRAANLSKVNLREAYLVNAYLSKADLSEANLSDANLSGANFRDANLGMANLSRTSLNRTNFREAVLIGVNLSGANFRETNLKAAYLGGTIFGGTDLSEIISIGEVFHESPSSMDTHTLQRSKGKIPAVFLRGCGLSDFEIELARLYSLNLGNQEINDILYKIYDLRARQSIQVSPIFISYSHADAAFVDRLEVMLNEKGIRFWRDIHDAKAGRLEKQIEQAIRHNPTVLLVLSKNSIKSDWVEHEVRTARELAKELGRDVLCPVALDGAWKTASWPERIMEQVMEYNILDFSKWEDEQVFGQMFVKLLDGLQLFYKG